MTQAAYVVAGYTATAGILAVYSLRVVTRRRSLSRRLHPPAQPVETSGAGAGSGREAAGRGDGAAGEAAEPRC